MTTTADDAPKGGMPRSRLIGLFTGLVLLLITLLFPPPGDLPGSAWAALGLMMLMAAWWATEAIPIPATSLVPIVLIPALDLGSVKDATTPYANPIIFLFLGGFTLGLAMQRWNLHRRVALHILLKVGTSPRRQIGGFMLATAFLSMWVSNTATTIMMLPIGLSVLSMMEGSDEDSRRRFAVALLLAIAYSASVGGIATLIGTPPNALLAGYLSDEGINVGFAQWMVIGVPIALLMLVIIWWWLTRRDFGLGGSGDSGQSIRDELAGLGRMSNAEVRVAIVFVLTAAAWIFRPLYSDLAALSWVSDTVIAIFAAIMLFLIRSGQRDGNALMEWDVARDLPWGVLLLFGGGLALAGVISSSGLADAIAESMSALDMLPMLMLVGLVVAVIIFLTEVTSNTATAAAFLPLLGALAMGQDISPVLLTVPAAIAASCAFMMPVATPPNAIVFGSGHLAISDMIKAGFVLNLIGILLVTLLGYLLMGVAFSV
ncbi:MAG: SLC13 family permease [Marinobacter sp.]